MAATYFAGHARDGRLVVVTRNALFFPARVSMEEHAKSVCHMMEHAIAAMPPGVEQMINIMDMSGMGLSNHDTAKSNLAMDIHKKYYPDRLSFCVICNVPSFFRMIWGGMKRMLDPAVVAKTHVLKLDAAKNLLLQHIAPEVLEVQYGGERTEPYPTMLDNIRAAEKADSVDHAQLTWRSRREERSPSMQMLFDQYAIPYDTPPRTTKRRGSCTSLRAPATVRCALDPRSADVGQAESAKRAILVPSRQ